MPDTPEKYVAVVRVKHIFNKISLGMPDEDGFEENRFPM